MENKILKQTNLRVHFPNFYCKDFSSFNECASETNQIMFRYLYLFKLRWYLGSIGNIHLFYNENYKLSPKETYEKNKQPPQCCKGCLSVVIRQDRHGKMAILMKQFFLLSLNVFPPNVITMFRDKVIVKIIHLLKVVIY